jgi:hypothetical protein
MTSVKLLLATILTCPAVSACGGATHKASTPSDPLLATSQCMRAHGVPNFPDPTKGPGGEGLSINATPGSSTIAVNGITFSGPAFQAAAKTCKFQSSGGRPPISEGQKLAALHFAQCMRKRGVPDYPDPTFPASGGITRANQPRESGPAVKHAAATCNKATGV